MKLAWSCILLPLALIACDDPASEGGSGGAGGGGPCPSCCESDLAMTGEVDGAPMPAATDRIESVWFNQIPDEEPLGLFDEVVMDELGLDPEAPPDVERYRYLVTEGDYRFLASELGPEEGIPIRNKDVTVFYFDLLDHPADLEHAIPVFDLSAIEQARDSGSRQALGDAVRLAADTMRDNGHPDVVVAYAADRSSEGLGNTTVSLLSPSARLASGGNAWIHEVQPVVGDAFAVIVGPLPTLASLSLRVEPVFPDPADTMRLDARCLPVRMSDG